MNKMLVQALLLSAIVVPGRADSATAETKLVNLPGYITLSNKVVKPSKSFDDRSVAEILTSDLIRNGKIRIDYFDAKITDLKYYLEQTFRLFCQVERKELSIDQCKQPLAEFSKIKGKDAEKVFKKFSEEDSAIGLKFVISELTAAKQMAAKLTLEKEADLNSQEFYAFYQALTNALEAEESIRQTDQTKSKLSNMAVSTVKSVFRTSFKNTSPPALNLVDSRSASLKFYSPRELTQMRQSGSDLSLLDPGPSGLWTRPSRKISEFNTTNYNGETISLVGREITDPSLPINVAFKNIKGGGRSPKFNVTYKDKSYKLKLAIDVPNPIEAGTTTAAYANLVGQKFETQVESVVNNLAAAIGYNVDPTYYKKSVRLFFADGFDASKMETPDQIAQYRKRFDSAKEKVLVELETEGVGANFGDFKKDYRSALSEVLEVESGDQKGRRYINVKGVSLELRPEVDVQIGLGGYNKSSYGRKDRREFRAFQIFFAWIYDKDTKDTNSDLALRPNKDGGLELRFIQADMGASLGNLFIKNSPNDFSADLVSFDQTELTGSDQKIVLTYHTIYKNEIWESVNFDDARWIVRMMAELTPKQIRDAFEAADYPPYIAELFTQKMLRRRDQLVRALNLQAPSLSSIGDTKTYAVPGFEKCFVDGLYRRVPGICDEQQWEVSLQDFRKGTEQREVITVALTSGLSQVTATVLRKVQRFALKSSSFIDGFKVGLDSFIPARYIIKNPLVEEGISVDSPYWIVDVVRIGVGADYNTTAANDITDLLVFGESPWGAKVARTYEYLVVRPTKDPADFGKDLVTAFIPGKNLFETIRGIKGQLLEGLSEGDLLIHSTYDTLGVKLSTTSTMVDPFTPVLTGTANTTLTKRVSVLKTKDSKALVNWADLKQLAATVDISLRTFVLQFAKFRTQIDRLSQVEKTFEFDFADKNQMSLLKRQIGRFLPLDGSAKDVELMKQLARNSLIYKGVKKSASFGIFGWPTNQTFSGTETLVFEDNKDEIPANYYSASKGKKNAGFHIFSLGAPISGVIQSDAFYLPDGNFYARTTIEHSNSFATKKDFLKLTKKYLPLLPSALVSFDPNSVSEYLGTLELEGELFFSKAALTALVSDKKSNNSICRLLAQRNGALQAAPNLCRDLNDNIDVFKYATQNSNDMDTQLAIRTAILGSREFLNLNSDMKSNCSLMLKAKTPSPSTVQNCLKKVVALLEIKPMRAEILGLIQSFVPEASVFRYAKLTSSLGGFPAMVGEIKLHKLDQAKYEKSEIEKKLGIKDMISNEFMTIQNALAGLFYNFEVSLK